MLLPLSLSSYFLFASLLLSLSFFLSLSLLQKLNWLWQMAAYSESAAGLGFSPPVAE